MIRALLFALLALVIVHRAMHKASKPIIGEIIGYSHGLWTSDCVREGLDARRVRKGHRLS